MYFGWIQEMYTKMLLGNNSKISNLKDTEGYDTVTIRRIVKKL